MIITNHRGKSILRGGARHTPTRNYGPSKLYDGRLPSLVRKMREWGEEKEEKEVVGLSKYLITNKWG